MSILANFTVRKQMLICSPFLMHSSPISLEGPLGAKLRYREAKNLGRQLDGDDDDDGNLK